MTDKSLQIRLFWYFQWHLTSGRLCNNLWTYRSILVKNGDIFRFKFAKGLLVTAQFTAVPSTPVCNWPNIGGKSVIRYQKKKKKKSKFHHLSQSQRSTAVFCIKFGYCRYCRSYNEVGIWLKMCTERTFKITPKSKWLLQQWARIQIAVELLIFISHMFVMVKVAPLIFL